MDRDLIFRARMHAVLRATVRRFFADQGFVEVDTPVAIRAPAPERYIEAPEVSLQTAHGPQRRFLQTSPELGMKRLLAAGLDKIYQIAPAFRDGDHGPLHTPEFRLLEWYRAHETWERLLDDCEGLLRACFSACGRGSRFAFGPHTVDISGPFERVQMDTAFARHAGFSLLETPDRASLEAAIRTHTAVHFEPDDTWDILFHRVFLNIVEPALLRNREKPLFLTHYPAQLAALARLSPDDCRVAERFELYVGGVELANGFGELTDAAQQRQRFVEEKTHRLLAGHRDYPLDEDFLAVLPQIGSAAGIALGIDRLGMLVLNASHIEDAAPIAWSKS